MIKTVITEVFKLGEEYCERCYYSVECTGALVSLGAERGSCVACLRNVPRETLEKFQREKTPVYIDGIGRIVLEEK